MTNRTRRWSRFHVLLAGACLLLAPAASAQTLSGALIGVVKDPQGGVVPGAVVRVASPALIGGSQTVTTNEKGQLRFPILPPGRYTIDVEKPGFATYHGDNIFVGLSGTTDVTIVLTLGSVDETVVVTGTGSRIDARDPGFGTRFGADDLRAIPTRRTSMFDFIKATPGISPTSPASGTINTVSSFGSGTNENTFLIDGTNFTCPCNGVARSEPGVDFIQEIHVQSVGASAEFGNTQGAVINVVTRQGGERFQSDTSYYGQTAGVTSQPVQRPVPNSGGLESGYERARYRDFATSLGGPVLRERLWFFAGYQYLRDYDSQPGSAPQFPRKYEQDKVLGKLTWRFSPRWQLVQSLHYEHWVSPEQPTLTKPFDATSRRTASVPAVTFGHLTHTATSNTVWDVRVGRFVFAQEDGPSTGDRTIPGRIDSVTGVSSGAPASFGGPTIARLTTKATISHYRPAVFGADHQWKGGGQVEKGEHHATGIIPTGRRFIDNNGQPSEVVSSAPSNTGGEFISVSAFASDAITVGERLTISAGVRFDYNRAVSQDLPAIDAEGRETSQIVAGLGTLYTWNLWSPRLGLIAKLTADGRTLLRASYGRFHQGVLTGEIAAFHPGGTPVTTTQFSAETGDYTGPSRTVDPRLNLLLDPATRAPFTDELSIGVDREVGRRVAVALAYVRKDGRDFIGWTDVGGQYRERTQPLPEGESVKVFELENGTAARRFLVTNPDGYSLTYNGLVTVVEKRRSHGWQAFGSYTWSRTSGLQPSSGATAAGAQVSTIAPPPGPSGLTFGRDPNDLTNARGRLPNDRPHIFRVMGTFDVPRTGIAIAANFQYFSGKPWARSASVRLTQNPQQRVLLEPRGSQRLSSQSLLDLRISRPFAFAGVGRVELLLDVLNALNDSAEEALATDNRFSPTFAVPTVFMDPRRAMIGVRVNFGR